MCGAPFEKSKKWRGESMTSLQEYHHQVVGVCELLEVWVPVAPAERAVRHDGDGGRLSLWPHDGSANTALPPSAARHRELEADVSCFGESGENCQG